MPDKKKIVFRVITEDDSADAAYVVRVLSHVSGVQSVAFDERYSLATIIGDFDVDGIVSDAKADGIRLRVRDIDVNYVPEPEQDNKQTEESSEQPVLSEQPEQPVAQEQVEQSEEQEYSEQSAERQQFVEQERPADFADDKEAPFADEFYNDDADEYELCDAELVSDNEDDEPLVRVTDRPSFTDMINNWGSKLNDALDRGAKAISGAGKKIADFADNVFTKAHDLGGAAKGGTQVKSMPDRYPVPYAEMHIAAKYVTENDVIYFEGSGFDADRLKIEAREKLPDEFSGVFFELIDSKFTGKYKYVKNGAALKLSVKPKI